MYTLRQKGVLGQDPLSGVQDQVTSVVHHCDCFNPSCLLRRVSDVGHARLGIWILASVTSRPIPKFRKA